MRRVFGTSNSMRRAAMAAPKLAMDEERELAVRARRGDARALDALVRSHLRLVYAIAEEFRPSGIGKDDLVSEGMLALVVAARRFDPVHGVRLSSYASVWIRTMLRRYTLSNRRAVRAPSSRNGRRALANLNRSERNLAQQAGEAPDHDAIARALGVDAADVDLASQALYARDLAVGTGDSREPGTIPVASVEPDPECQVARAEEQRASAAMIASALEQLGDRERGVLQARFLHETPSTLSSLGAGLGVSRERVRQIEEGAYQKLRAAVLASVA